MTNYETYESDDPSVVKAKHIAASNEKKSMPFWSEDPNILLSPSFLLELFPTPNMSYSQKLNAITRLVLFLTIAIFMMTRKLRILVIGLFSLGAIYVVHQYDENQREKTGRFGKDLETFAGGGIGATAEESPAMAVLAERGIDPHAIRVFDEPTPANPFSNVDVSMYGTSIDKKPAPPAYNGAVNDRIMESIKQEIRTINKDNSEISDPTKDRLFGDLADNFSFEQSLRQYYSMPSTTVAGDQRAFAEFCYGSMVSCKEGNNFACARNLARHVE